MNTHRRKRYSPSEKVATPEDVARVKKLFDDKSWPLTSSEFNDFCTMIANLANEDQKDLVLELSKRFCWITANQYYQMFVNAFNQMIMSKSDKVIRKLSIVILPLEESDNESDVKSGHFLYYMIKAHLPKLQQQYKAKCNTITCFKCPEEVVDKCSASFLCDDPDVFVCPVDDYIGSGDTAVRCLHNLESWGFPKEKIVFLALVAQERGIERCRQEAVCVFSDMQMKRQISDFPNSEKNAQIMNEIEDSINVKEKYHFGYAQSEALVKLERTPNNTFPVYWFSYKQRRTVPFPR